MEVRHRYTAQIERVLEVELQKKKLRPANRCRHWMLCLRHILEVDLQNKKGNRLLITATADVVPLGLAK